jgi:ATP-dependent Zn protease
VSRGASRAFFPLLVIVALAWLASETLRGDSAEDGAVYSDVIARVETNPETIELVTFVPKQQRLEVRPRTGQTLKTHYPSEASQLEFQKLLQTKGVRFDSKGAGSSQVWVLLSTLLPFILLLGFWVLLTRSAPTRERSRDPGA